MNKKGFTLIETMVAVTILIFAMAGPLFTASRAIIATQTSRDQLVALYLAQEGIEYVRAVRDNNYLAAYHAGGETVSSDAWTAFLAAISKCDATPPNPPTQACTLDPISGLSLTSCVVGSTCAPLQVSGGIYRQQSGSFTPFTRTIQVVDVSASEEKVVATVTWSFHTMSYTVTVSDHLTSWK